MAHGNKRKASEGVRKSKCERKVRLREYLEGEAKSLVAEGLPVLSIVRALDDLAKKYRSESQGRR
jgi:hypothetical protein